jgi:hypothetical protein
VTEAFSESLFQRSWTHEHSHTGELIVKVLNKRLKTTFRNVEDFKKAFAARRRGG